MKKKILYVIGAEALVIVVLLAVCSWGLEILSLLGAVVFGVVLLIIVGLSGLALLGKLPWQRKSALTAAPADTMANRKYIEKKLLGRNIILVGTEKHCEAFYKKYHSKIKIKKILSMDNTRKTVKWDGKSFDIKPFNRMEAGIGSYIVCCCPFPGVDDKDYRQLKQKFKRNELVVIKDYIRSDVASMILDNKKLWMWFGYCQLDTMQNNIFNKLPAVKDQYMTVTFRYEKDTVKSSFKYDDVTEMLKLCDVMTYIPLMVTQDKIDFAFEDYMPKAVKKIALPRIPFKAYYPYRQTDGEIFFEYSVDGKKHWPFGYQEVIIDDMIVAGKSDDEIYQELMREDLIPEKTILKTLRYTYKFIEIAEKTSDIKILDYIKENFNKRMLYRDGTHYQNCMYFELSRRILQFMGIDCRKEVDALEAEVEKKGTQFISFTEVPVLPCVANALGLSFVTDETLWQVRFTEGGAWRGKITRKGLTRKEWIYAYVEYTRACYHLSKHWQLVKE